MDEDDVVVVAVVAVVVDDATAATASSTDRENEAPSRVIDGTALYTVSSAKRVRASSARPNYV